jgi:hypothetical protein
MSEKIVEGANRKILLFIHEINKWQRKFFVRRYNGEHHDYFHCDCIKISSNLCGDDQV